MIFTEQEKRKNLNAIIKKYGSKEKAYRALEIGLSKAKQAGDELTVKKFLELISYFDREFGIFSIS